MIEGLNLSPQEAQMVRSIYGIFEEQPEGLNDNNRVIDHPPVIDIAQVENDVSLLIMKALCENDPEITKQHLTSAYERSPEIYLQKTAELNAANWLKPEIYCLLNEIKRVEGYINYNHPPQPSLFLCSASAPVAPTSAPSSIENPAPSAPPPNFTPPSSEDPELGLEKGAEYQM